MNDVPAHDHERHRAAAEAEIARFVEVTAEADPATPLPTCPGWTVADLMRHLGTIYRWMTHIVVTRPARRIPATELGIEPPADDGACHGWLAAGVEPLTTALRATDGDEPVWTLGPDQHLRLWSSRLLAETLVHRADVELALGRTPAVDQEVAADAVEEFLTTVLHYDRVIARLKEFGHAGETVHLHATDGEGEWTATLGADGRTAWERGHSKGSVAVRGTAADLLFLLWGRYPLDERFTVFGDEELLRALLAELSV